MSFNLYFFIALNICMFGNRRGNSSCGYINHSPKSIGAYFVEPSTRFHVFIDDKSCEDNIYKNV